MGCLTAEGNSISHPVCGRGWTFLRPRIIKKQAGLYMYIYIYIYVYTRIISDVHMGVDH